MRAHTPSETRLGLWVYMVYSDIMYCSIYCNIYVYLELRWPQGCILRDLVCLCMGIAVPPTVATWEGFGWNGMKTGRPAKSCKEQKNPQSRIKSKGCLWQYFREFCSWESLPWLTFTNCSARLQVQLRHLLQQAYLPTLLVIRPWNWH